MTSGHKLALLATLYLAQGLPFGFFHQTIPVVLRAEGVSLPKIGLATLLALPWALKFLWAPWVDRLGSRRWGRRRGWILPLQLASAGLLLLLAAADPSSRLWVLLVGVTLINLLAATQDVATDGLAVDLLTPAERGWGNGVQVAGYRAGMIVGGGGLLVVLDALGWSATCFLAAAALLAASLPVARLREPSPAVTRDLGPSPGARAHWDLGRPGWWAWLLLIGGFKAGEALGMGMLRPFLVDAHLSLAQIGWLLGWIGFSAGLLGALAGGALVGRLGRRRALVAFGLLQVVGQVAFALLVQRGVSGGAPADLWLLAGVCGFEHVVSGMATAALFTAMMDVCRPEAAATDYTLQACAVVVATGLGSALSGVSAQALGYDGNFALGAGLALAGTVWLGVSWPGVRAALGADEAAHEATFAGSTS